MKTENNSLAVVSQVGADALAQRISEVLSASPDSLVKVKEINISVEPVIAHRIVITIIPKN
jgi:hypothetical protein